MPVANSALLKCSLLRRVGIVRIANLTKELLLLHVNALLSTANRQTRPRPPELAPGKTPLCARRMLVDKLSELVQVDVAARHNGYDLAGAGTARQTGRDRAGCSTFDDNPVPLCHHFHGLRGFRQSDHQ
jgi:hypothetical protein